jgi:hypothetical protein
MSPSENKWSTASARELATAFSEIDDVLDPALFEAAGRKRSELTPIFLSLLDKTCATSGDISDEEKILLLFAVLLLGEWKEPLAYPAICRFLQIGHGVPEELLDDALTESLPRVLVSCATNDPQPIFDVILREEIYDFGRSIAFEVLSATLVHDMFPRDVVVDFLRSCPELLLPKEEDIVWEAWERAVENFGLTDLGPAVKKAYDAGFIDPQTSDYASFEESLANGVEAAATGDYSELNLTTPWENTFEELSTWYGFSEEGRRERAHENEFIDEAPDWLQHLPPIDLPTENRFSHIGRNDPCPCGSGKKFKKCHLGREAEL